MSPRSQRSRARSSELLGVNPQRLLLERETPVRDRAELRVQAEAGEHEFATDVHRRLVEAQHAGAHQAAAFRRRATGSVPSMEAQLAAIRERAHARDGCRLCAELRAPVHERHALRLAARTRAPSRARCRPPPAISRVLAVEILCPLHAIQELAALISLRIRNEEAGAAGTRPEATGNDDAAGIEARPGRRFDIEARHPSAAPSDDLLAEVESRVERLDLLQRAGRSAPAHRRPAAPGCRRSACRGRARCTGRRMRERVHDFALEAQKAELERGEEPDGAGADDDALRADGGIRCGVAHGGIPGPRPAACAARAAILPDDEACMAHAIEMPPMPIARAMRGCDAMMAAERSARRVKPPCPQSSSTREGRRQIDMRAIAVLALPLVLNSTVQAVLNLTDTWFIGRLSTSATAAIAAVHWLALLAIFMIGGVAMGVQTLVAAGLRRRPLPAHQPDRLARPLGIRADDSRIRADGRLRAGDDPRLRARARTSRRSRSNSGFRAMIGGPLAAALWAAVAYFNGVGTHAHSRWPSVLLVLGSNAILNEIFIFRFGMGMAGAAWATTAARADRRRARDSHDPAPRARALSRRTLTWRPKARRLVTLIALGLPMAMTACADIGAAALFQLMQVQVGVVDGAGDPDRHDLHGDGLYAGHRTCARGNDARRPGDRCRRITAWAERPRQSHHRGRRLLHGRHRARDRPRRQLAACRCS